MITLYYIPGISEVDEPNIEVGFEDEFFTHYKVIDIDAGFYPPHLKNEIILSTDDVTFTTSVNYLSLLYNNKNYYYFINNIEYISEDTLKLNVSMDTIQTYKDNIKFLQSDINRRSIARWVEKNDKWIFNRNYIRTNRSVGTMEQKVLNYVSRDIGWYVIIYNSNANLHKGEIDTRSALLGEAGLSNSPLDSCNVTPLVSILAIPTILKSGYTKVKIGNVSYTKFENLDRIRTIGGINGVESITYYDYNVFKEYITITGDTSSGTITITSSDDRMRILHCWNLLDPETGTYIDLGWLVSPAGIFNVPYYYTDISLPVFGRVTTEKATPIAMYVPAMLDENYIQVEWGERVGYTTYPLHYIYSNSPLYGVCMVNYIDGGRTYYLAQNKTIDIYHTLITNTTIEQVALYNNEWQSYVSQNMCTLMRGRALSYQQIGYSNIKNNFKENSKMNELLYSEKGVTPENFYLYNAKKAINYAKYATDVSAQISLYNQSREIQEANIKAQPDAQKVGNSCSSDCLSSVLQVFQKVSYCSDYDDVAKDYEQNGYDVAEHTSSNLFYALNKRYYYNVIRVSSVEFYLENVIADSTTIINIRNRFINGLRLWETNAGVLNAKSIGDYTYDNVEKAFLD